jgi:hypothetical protein
MSSNKPPGRRDKKRMSTRKAPVVPRRPASGSEGGELPHHEFLVGIDEALRSADPLALLMLASGIITTLDPRQQNPLAIESGQPTLVDLCESFLEAGLRQTDALLTVIGEMAGDDLLRERIRRSVAQRRHAIPGWVVRLGEARPYRAVEMTHVLKDGDNVVVGVGLPGKREVSLVIYIDHNLGTVVKDAFVLGAPIDEVMVSWNAVDPMSGAEMNELSLADARARIVQSITSGAMTFPPYETDTWPACRPLVEWIVAMMPDEGSGYTRPDWSKRQLATLTRSFFASQFGASLDDEDHRSLLESILWFGTDYGPGDPLRWSPVAIEILLADWIPRKIVAPADFLSKAPTVLRAFVRYCHAERQIPRALTDDTIEAIDRWEPDYQLAIGSPRNQGAMELLERLGLLPGTDGDWDDDEGPDGTEHLSHNEYMLDSLARSVGGMRSLETLTTEALPVEPLDRTGIPDDIVTRVAEISELVDGCCDDLFDEEFRTASRRLLARVAVADSDIFRRKSSAATTAAAICWIIAKANNSFDLYGMSGSGGPRVKDLMTHFGLTGSVSQRAEPMIRAIWADWRFGRTTVGDPRLLVSSTRLRIEETRDLYRIGE